MYGAAWKNDWNLVFTREGGRPVSRQHALRFVLRPLLERAGLPTTLRFHDIRHIAASHAISLGVPMPIVSKMLGHSSVATTARVYSHAVPGTERQFVDALQKLYAPISDSNPDSNVGERRGPVTNDGGLPVPAA